MVVLVVAVTWAVERRQGLGGARDGRPRQQRSGRGRGSSLAGLTDSRRRIDQLPRRQRNGHSRPGQSARVDNAWLENGHVPMTAKSRAYA